MTDNGDPFCSIEGAGIRDRLEHFRDQRPKNEPITVEEAVELLELMKRTAHMVLDDVLARGGGEG